MWRNRQSNCKHRISTFPTSASIAKLRKFVTKLPKFAYTLEDLGSEVMVMSKLDDFRNTLSEKLDSASSQTSSQWSLETIL